MMVYYLSGDPQKMKKEVNDNWSKNCQFMKIMNEFYFTFYGVLCVMETVNDNKRFRNQSSRAYAHLCLAFVC